MSTRSSPGSFLLEDVTTKFQQNGETVPPSSHVATHLWSNSVTFGENFPGWRQRLRDGLPTTTSMVGTKVTIGYSPGYLDVEHEKFFPDSFPGLIYRERIDGLHAYYSAIPSQNPAELDFSRADAEALGKFNRRIIETLTAFRGGVFLGELGQTLRTIRNPAQGLRALAGNFRTVAQQLRRDRSLARLPSRLRNIKLGENLADAWLEAQFGWRPLISDIDDGCKALALLRLNQMPATRRCTARSQTDGPSTEEEFTGGANTRWKLRVVTRGHCQVIYRGAVRVDAQNPSEMKTELLGFNPAQWIPTAWELIPYSFLIDYFTNIGDIINGWSALFTHLAWSQRTVRRGFTRIQTASSDESLQIPFYTPIKRFRCVPGKYVCEKTCVERTKLEGTSVPSFHLRVPGDWSLKWLNIAALIASRRADRKWSYGD
jgi:hypothetical protein